MLKKLQPILFLMIAVVSIQCGASMAKQLFPVTGAVGATFWRVFFASMVLIPFFRPWKEKLTRREFRTILFYGCSLGCMNSLFYLSLNRLPLGIAVALEFTGPLAVALCSSRKKIDLFWSLLAVAGLLVIVPIFQVDHSQIDPIGALFALGSGVCWALYMVFGKKARVSVSAGVLVSWGMLVATFATIPIAWISQGNLPTLSSSILPFAFFVGLLSSAIPYFLESVTIKSLSLTTFGILMSLEPVIAALSGLIILKESLSTLQWLAIAFIITASMGSILSSKQDLATTD